MKVFGCNMYLLLAVGTEAFLAEAHVYRDQFPLQLDESGIAFPFLIK